MRPTLLWRKASLDDIACLAAMNFQLIQDEGHRNPMQSPALEERMHGWLATDYEAILFEEASAIVAYALHRREGKERFYFRQFFVERAARRRGIGREAIRLLREEVWPAHARIVVSVLVHNESAIRFWHAVGFSDYSLTMEVDGTTTTTATFEVPRELPPPPADYSARMPRFAEAAALASVGLDFHGRDAFLDPATAAEWRRMKAAAADAGLELLLISGFRSRAYQSALIARKLARGESLDSILRVNTYPGFSEHHTGRAVDIGCRACPELTETFDNTEEFCWLSANAHRFGFALSYPRNNSHGILYEPWHWASQ